MCETQANFIRLERLRGRAERYQSLPTADKLLSIDLAPSASSPAESGPAGGKDGSFSNDQAGTGIPDDTTTREKERKQRRICYAITIELVSGKS